MAVLVLLRKVLTLLRRAPVPFLTPPPTLPKTPASKYHGAED